jgi:rhamnosyl/mannosyltransferase
VLVTNRGWRTAREVVDGIPIVRAARLATVGRNPLSWSIVTEMARAAADIIHLHFPYPMGEMAYLLAGRHRKMVITYHSDIVKQRSLLLLYRPLLWQVLARADRIIATSPSYIKTSPFLRPFAAKTSVIPLGIDLERFQNPDLGQVEAIRQRYGHPLVLFVGLLRYYKGLPFLIRAMKQVPARLLIVGSGPLEKDLKALTEAGGLQQKVIFVGEVADEELPAYYHASELYVLPATHRSEALGVAQMEAMACAKPVVCTELGTGTTFVNVHGETGLVVPPASEQALAEAIGRLLADDGLRLRLGQGGRKRVSEEFTKELMAERIIEVYRQLLT